MHIKGKRLNKAHTSLHTEYPTPREAEYTLVVEERNKMQSLPKLVSLAKKTFLLYCYSC